MTGVPVIMDMEENYPAMIESNWLFRGARPLDYLLRNPRLLARWSAWLNRAWEAFVVSEANRRRIQVLDSVMAPIWVGATSRLLGYAPGPSIVRCHPMASGLTLLYVGFLEHMRAIRSLPTLVAKGIHPLLVVGEGEHRPGLEKLVSSLGMASHVHFAGWIDQRYLPAIIAAADICLIPHYVTEHTDTTLPNKIFDYMAQGQWWSPMPRRCGISSNGMAASKLHRYKPGRVGSAATQGYPS